jgi:hypothetical protein
MHSELPGDIHVSTNWGPEHPRVSPTARRSFQRGHCSFPCLRDSHLWPLLQPSLGVWKRMWHLHKYCHVHGVCVTSKTGFRFDDRIYWTFTQLVTTVHKSLSGTLSYSSTGHSRLLTTRHYSTTPLYSIVLPRFWSTTLFCTNIASRRIHREHVHFVGMDVSCCPERASTGPLPINGYPIVERLCHGTVFAYSFPSNGSHVTVWVNSACQSSFM